MSERQAPQPPETQKSQLSELTPLPPLPEQEAQASQKNEAKLSVRGLAKAISSFSSDFREGRRQQKEKGESAQLLHYDPKQHQKDRKRDKKLYKNMDRAVNNSVIRSVYGDSPYDTGQTFGIDSLGETSRVHLPQERAAVKARRYYKKNEKKINETSKAFALGNPPEDKDLIKKLASKGWRLSDEEKGKQRRAPTDAQIKEAYAIHELLNTPTAPKESPVGDPDTESRVEKVVSFVTRVDSDLSKLTGVVLTKNQLTLDDFQYLVRRSNRKATLIDVAKTIDRLEAAGIIVETETLGTWKTTITPDEYKLAEKYAFDEIREHKEPSTPAKEENSRTDFAPRSGIDIDVLRRLNSEITEAIRDGVRTAKDEQGLDQVEELTREKFEEIRDSTVERCIKAQLVELDEAIKEDSETLDRKFVLVKGDLSAIAARTKRK